MPSPLLRRIGAVVIFASIALSQSTGQHSAKVVDCADLPGDGVLPPEPEVNTQNLRVGFVSFGDSRASLIIYEDRNGEAVFQGDIVLGTTAAMQQSTSGMQGPTVQGIVLTGPIQWPGATVPSEID